MRATFAICLLAGVLAGLAPVSAHPRLDEEVMIMPPERFCFGPMAWDALAKCMALHVPNAKVLASPTASTQLVRLGPNETLLYIRSSRNIWRLVQQFSDDQYAITGERAIRVLDRPGVRIDVRQQSRLAIGVGQYDELTERVAFVCADGEPCTRLVYACTVMSRGRAIETFRGDVVIGDGRPRVEGDRSQSGARCTGL